MITPGKVARKKVTIPASINGEGGSIARTDIHFADKNIALLVGPDLLLRFQYKEQREGKILKRLKEKMLKDKKIFAAERQRFIQKFLVADREIRELLNKDKKDLAKRNQSEFEDFLNNLKRRQDTLKTLAKKLKFEVIRPHREYFCKNCHGFRPGPGLAQTENPTCTICSNLLKKLSINQIDTDVVNYLTGYWLEDYIANILNKQLWKAWSSPTLMIYGVSSAAHQIDVLAVKEGRVLIIECKSGEFLPTQVMNFLGKYHDIRCHKAFAVAIGRIHPDAKKIIEKNAAIDYYDNIKNYAKLVKKISQI
jgi:RNase P subunit RPR2